LKSSKAIGVIEMNSQTILVEQVIKSNQNVSTWIHIST
jgi:hypothetical protein